MRKFEYLVQMVFFEEWEAYCSRRGAEGWEVIEQHYTEDMPGYIVFFKREVDQNAPIPA